MISCTEFIPAYSELFTYIEEKDGRAAVDKFWEYLFKPDGRGIPLVNFVKKEGIRGCYTYWSGTLNEEAADFTMYLNERDGWYFEKMHRCPSKGRLLELADELGITPYHDYCLHCDSYRSAIESVGLKYTFNFAETDKAACSLLVYDPKVFDGRMIVDKDTIVMDRRAADNEYFHPDFHSSMNMGIHYIGMTYGDEGVLEYLARYTKNVYRRLAEKIKAEGVKALREKIEDTYDKEHARELLEIEEGERELTVRVKHCPAVTHLKATGREVSPWYRYTTEWVMRALADEVGYGFDMLAYDEKDGRACYKFTY
ncbi:MAG: hypothetical protein IKA64_07340 [Clostridia bacterium]|nr:hypothetical protein [Clostridia bacterium]